MKKQYELIIKTVVYIIQVHGYILFKLKKKVFHSFDLLSEALIREWEDCSCFTLLYGIRKYYTFNYTTFDNYLT